MLTNRINVTYNMENIDADFLLTSGNRIMIKRKRFEEFLDSSSVI